MGAAIILSFGWAGLAPLGLLVGNLLALGAGALRLGRAAWRHNQKQLSVLTYPQLRDCACRFRRFPFLPRRRH